MNTEGDQKCRGACRYTYLVGSHAKKVLLNIWPWTGIMVHLKEEKEGGKERDRGEKDSMGKKESNRETMLEISRMPQMVSSPVVFLSHDVVV